ncbi:hypothetical protein LCGC14_0592980 [marine sediment metagenome]|uniref:Hint domain-containing protein n=1 Tax=marine sediment metagenome TaxID=412755 RepID=A0A0F9RCY8_9ZZZZ
MGDFATPDGRGEFPTSNFQQVLDAVVTTVVADRSYYIEPLNILTGADDGSVARIDIASFVAHWPDIPKVTYASQTIGNLSFSTKYGVYLDDVDRDGVPDVCLFVTTNTEELFQAPGRLFLGTVTTPADGGVDTSGGGGGGGGDEAGCILVDTAIVTLGAQPFLRQELAETYWSEIHLKDGRKLRGTRNHPVYTERGKVSLSTVGIGSLLITDVGLVEVVANDYVEEAGTKWQVIMPRGHLYWANGILSHNLKAPPL